MAGASEHIAAHSLGDVDDIDTEVAAIEYLRIRLLVVDPHPLVRWALGQIAAGRPDLTQVGEAATIDEAIALSFAVKPDVITIDDSLPGVDTWQLAAHLRAAYPDLGIVILSTDGSDRTLFRALDVGASAFVAQVGADHRRGRRDPRRGRRTVARSRRPGWPPHCVGGASRARRWP